MKTYKLTYNLSKAICSGQKWSLENFILNGKANQYIDFTHFSFFYSYPEFGQQWKDDKSSQFHRVETSCKFCNFKPERNYTGVGTLYLLHNGINQEDTNYRSNPLVLLCQFHLDNYQRFEAPVVKFESNQLSLF